MLTSHSRNCAPINITGGTDDEAAMAELPGIFIANYPHDPEVPNCTTGISADKVVVNYPHPGKYGRVLQAPVGPVNKPSGYCSQIPPANLVPTFESDVQTTVSSGKTRPTESTTSPSVRATSLDVQTTLSDGGKTRPTESTTTPSVRATSLVMGTNMPTTDGAASSPAPHLRSTTPPSEPSFLTSHTPPSRTESATTNLGHDNPASPTDAIIIKKPFYDAIACTTHGEIVCLEKGTMFGMCNWGWAVPQEVAAGTECQGGKIVKREAVGGGGGDSDGMV